eukprot:CAMPEP_0182581870 /NCGR_PEP_ID=MMETSP1324-20130603/51170_1 /TAXON_ID=236786 /ORGANISM="Florenciella sp., Strain RCC1587" /LENGTH=52 /DNA_ID=CAMNT_0024798283 /DNA_START=35 /DNA_END=190 /DNA_ORIENTATION=+
MQVIAHFGLQLTLTSSAPVAAIALSKFTFADSSPSSVSASLWCAVYNTGRGE